MFPKERSNAKGVMMSFAPKRPDVFPEERSNGKRAMMSFVPKRPDVFPRERSCISWTVMLLVSSQVRWALEAVFWWPGRLPPRVEKMLRWSCEACLQVLGKLF